MVLIAVHISVTIKENKGKSQKKTKVMKWKIQTEIHTQNWIV